MAYFKNYAGKIPFKQQGQSGLPDNTIWSMLQDKSGNIWFGSRNAGIYRYDGKTFVDFTERGC